LFYSLKIMLKLNYTNAVYKNKINIKETCINYHNKKHTIEKKYYVFYTFYKKRVVFIWNRK